MRKNDKGLTQSKNKVRPEPPTSTPVRSPTSTPISRLKEIEQDLINEKTDLLFNQRRILATLQILPKQLSNEKKFFKDMLNETKSKMSEIDRNIKNIRYIISRHSNSP
jgi:hypothetical protein